MKERGRRILKAREDALRDELRATKDRLARAEAEAKAAKLEVLDLRRLTMLMRREVGASLRTENEHLLRKVGQLEEAIRKERAVAKAAARDREDAYAILAEADRKVAAARNGRFPSEHVSSFRVRAKRHITTDPS